MEISTEMPFCHSGCLPLF